MKIASWFLPTPKNNYRARLLSNTALCVYVILLVVSNIAFGNLSVVRSSAALNELDLVKLHNVQRSQQGLPGLSFNSLLAESARQKGVAMLESDCWSHYCPEGKSPWDFFRNVNYVYSFAGENLAEGFNNNEAVMRAWMNSKTHRENILKSEFTEVGIALVNGLYQGRQDNTVIVVHFGKPKGDTAGNTGSGGVTGNERSTGSAGSSGSNGFAGSNGSTGSTGQNPQDPPIKILSPKSGEIVATDSPLISGEVTQQTRELSYELKVTSPEDPAGQTSSGRIIPTGGIFTIATESLPDGSAKIDITAEESIAFGDNLSGRPGQTAQSAQPSQLNQTAQAVSREFTIDTTPPIVNNQDISALRTITSPDGTSSTSFLLTPAEKLQSAEIVAKSDTVGTQLFPLTQLQETGETPGWSVDISSPERFSDASLILTDLAGNTSTTPISLEKITTSATVQTAGVSVDNGINWLQIFGIIVVSFLLGLFIIDHVQMRKLKQKLQLPQVERSHLHIPTLSILLLMIIMGNFTGMI